MKNVARVPLWVAKTVNGEDDWCRRTGYGQGTARKVFVLLLNRKLWSSGVQPGGKEFQDRRGREGSRKVWRVNPQQRGSISPSLGSRMGTRIGGCGSVCRADVGRGFLTTVELPARSSVSVRGRGFILVCFSILWS